MRNKNEDSKLMHDVSCPTRVFRTEGRTTLSCFSFFVFRFSSKNNYLCTHKVMKGLRLYKSEKLCSHTAVGQLFGGEGNSTIAYPLRAVFRFHEPQGEAPAQFLITIPKKKIRTAVGRVLLRRRTREAYRLNRELLYPSLRKAGVAVDIAFIYLSTDKAPYEVIEAKMKELMGRISRDALKTVSHENPVD